MIYHGGTGKTIFLGMLRVTTIFIFGVSCIVVAPAFWVSDFPAWLAPASKTDTAFDCGAAWSDWFSCRRWCSSSPLRRVYVRAVCELYPSGSSYLCSAVSRAGYTVCEESAAICDALHKHDEVHDHPPADGSPAGRSRPGQDVVAAGELPKPESSASALVAGPHPYPVLHDGEKQTCAGDVDVLS